MTLPAHTLPAATFAPLLLNVSGVSKTFAASTFDSPSGLQTSFVFTASASDPVAQLRFSNISSAGDYKIYVLDTVEVAELHEDPAVICSLDPRSTYLKPTTAGDLAHPDDVQDAKKIELADGLPFPVQAGDWLRLRAVGDFKFTQLDPPPDPGPYGDGTLRDAIGVFSSSDTLLGETEADRVPDAVSVVEGNFSEVVSDPANEIAGDFQIPTQSVVPGGVLVRVPAGATHLFLGAADTQWFDNNPIPPDGDYGVSITRIYAGRFLGDYNFDGIVNAADYTVWRDGLGQSGVDLAGDGNLDGTVNEADYTIWREHFGQVVPAGGGAGASSTAVPEPSAFVLILCGILLLGGAGSFRDAPSGKVGNMFAFEMKEAPQNCGALSHLQQR